MNDDDTTPLVFESWPEVTSICCWNCTEPFDFAPVFLPYHFHEKKQLFFTKGVFCCFPCMKRYNDDHHHGPLHDRVSALISYMYKKMQGSILHHGVSTAPPVYRLRKFGGDLSTERYRACVPSTNLVQKREKHTPFASYNSSASHRVLLLSETETETTTTTTTTTMTSTTTKPSPKHTTSGVSSSKTLRESSTTVPSSSSTTKTTTTSVAHDVEHPEKKLSRTEQAARMILNAKKQKPSILDNLLPTDSLRLKRNKRIESHRGNRLMSTTLLNTLGIQIQGPPSSVSPEEE